jgi:hypothetical protein
MTQNRGGRSQHDRLVAELARLIEEEGQRADLHLGAPADLVAYTVIRVMAGFVYNDAIAAVQPQLDRRGFAGRSLAWPCVTASTARTGDRAHSARSPGWLADGAQLAALWGFAATQPLFEYLRDQSLVTTWSFSELAVFALGLTLLPPALMLAAEAAVGLIGDRPRRALHVILVGALVAVVAGDVAAGADPENDLLIAGAIVIGGAAATLAYIRLRAVREFLAFLVVAPVLFAVQFAFDQPENTLTLTADVALAPAPSDGPPVVLVVLDELPTASIMDGKGRLDSERLPSFARLAGDATWYRDAVTVADQTNHAVPALLTGRAPDLDASPSDADYPGNLFTLLGRTYRMNVFESVTTLCPAALCPQTAQKSFPRRAWNLVPTLRRVWLTGFLPERVAESLLGRPVVEQTESPQRQREFRTKITSGGGPALHYHHMFLPHLPWERLPDGRAYAPTLTEGLLFTKVIIDRAIGIQVCCGGDNSWAVDSSLVGQAQQAHLAQVGAADHALGKVLARLKATGQYDRSLIILTADHGAAFQPNQPFRSLRHGNASEILHVPLFVKLPGQRRGRVERGVVRSVDVVPTIADVVGVRLPWRADGRSLLAKRRPSDARLRIYSEFSEKFFSVDRGSLQRQRDAAVRRNARRFGRGTSTLELFELGPRPDLLGRTISAMRGAGFRRLPVDLAEQQALRSVNPKASVLPASLHGTLEAGRPGDELAVVLNGRVVATARSYRSRRKLRFVALAPPSAFRPGPNRVEVYAVPRAMVR